MNYQKACMACGAAYSVESQDVFCSLACIQEYESKMARMKELRAIAARLLAEEEEALRDVDLEVFEALSIELARVHREIFEILGSMAMRHIAFNQAVIH